MLDFKKYRDSFFLYESSDTEIASINLEISKLKDEISLEVKKRKGFDKNSEDEARSIDREASLYQKMPVLLKKLSSSIRTKSQSGE